MRPLSALLALLLSTSPALAQQPAPVQVLTPQQQGTRYITLSNGTGFFVSKDGYLITNAHVVRACTQKVRATNGAFNAEADVIARDDESDLALLRTNAYAPAIASLRTNNQDIKAGDPLVVMGYAGLQGAQGTYSFVKSHVIAAVGPTGQPYWLQFENAAQRGNSGGPLLDTSGHVIGVITGKTQLFRKDTRSNVAPAMISASDVAVNLPTLTAFLDRNRVRYQAASSGMLSFSDNRLEYDAKNYIVQLQCQTN